MHVMILPYYELLYSAFSAPIKKSVKLFRGLNFLRKGTGTFDSDISELINGNPIISLKIQQIYKFYYVPAVILLY